MHMLIWMLSILKQFNHRNKLIYTVTYMEVKNNEMLFNSTNWVAFDI